MHPSGVDGKVRGEGRRNPGQRRMGREPHWDIGEAAINGLQQEAEQTGSIDVFDDERFRPPGK